jgi:hypothetical protein
MALYWVTFTFYLDSEETDTVCKLFIKDLTIKLTIVSGLHEVQYFTWNGREA